ncbi:hypothetical protein MXB_166, partial [Myxobolus squamalis]
MCPVALDIILLVVVVFISLHTDVKFPGFEDIRIDNGNNNEGPQSFKNHPILYFSFLPAAASIICGLMLFFGRPLYRVTPEIIDEDYIALMKHLIGGLDDGDFIMSDSTEENNHSTITEEATLDTCLQKDSIDEDLLPESCQLFANAYDI